MLRPLNVDHAGSPVRRCVSVDVVLLVRNEVRPRRPTEAARLKTLGLNGGMVKYCAASFEKRSDIVGKPNGRKNRGHGPGNLGRQMIFGDHERDILRHPVVSPDLKDVLHELRLFIKSFPCDIAWLERVVLE